MLSKKERVMVRIVEYGMSDVGQVQIRNLLYGVGNQVLSHMDIEPMRQEINKAIYKGVTNWKATPPCYSLWAVVCLERHTARRVFGFIFNPYMSACLSHQIRYIRICIASC